MTFYVAQSRFFLSSKKFYVRWVCFLTHLEINHSIMSSVTVDGIIEITKGTCYYPPKLEKKLEKKSLHVHYKSVIQTASGK